eukprot:m.55184 g.55184  ORF g.55184 m.55184 type:complete len:117 (-) comp7743_c0_seq8:266-616(-)
MQFTAINFKHQTKPIKLFLLLTTGKQYITTRLTVSASERNGNGLLHWTSYLLAFQSSSFLLSFVAGLVADGHMIQHQFKQYWNLHNFLPPLSNVVLPKINPTLNSHQKCDSLHHFT